MKTELFKLSVVLLIFLQFSCSKRSSLMGIVSEEPSNPKCENLVFDYNNEKGCDGRLYPNPIGSPYVIPFPPGTNFKTGLTNCSSSYHGAQFPDRYAFDFDVPEGTNFYAARAGQVVFVRNDQSSQGGGSGNWLVIRHQDNTYGIYLHSPENGISVIEGRLINKGDLLGITGRSGLAGYPHLHFIVVQNDYKWPYDAIPITFNNILPADVIVKSNTNYEACSY